MSTVTGKRAQRPVQTSTGASEVNTNVSQGMRGAAVDDIQNALISLGIDTGPQDGIFGPLTKAAVQQFQREHGLKPDGIVGPLTRAAFEQTLMQQDGVQAPQQPARRPTRTQRADARRTADANDRNARGRAESRMGTPAVGDRTGPAPAGDTPSRDVVTRLNPEQNPRYLPHSGNTYCNVFTQDVMRERGVTDFPRTTANGTNTWLHDHGAEHGWRQVSGDEAQAHVNAGGVGLVSRANPSGHGHIAPIIEGDAQNGMPMIANAGSNNFNAGPASRSLAFRQSGTEFWVRDDPAVRPQAPQQPGTPDTPQTPSSPGTPPGYAEGEPRIPEQGPPRGTNLPHPPQYGAIKGPIDPAVVSKANEILHGDKPIGTQTPMRINGRDYLACVEWHKHAATDNVSDRLKDWHRGVSMYELKPGETPLPTSPGSPHPAQPSTPDPVAPPEGTPHPTGKAAEAYADNTDKAARAQPEVTYKPQIDQMMNQADKKKEMIDEIARKADLPPALVAGIWYREASLKDGVYMHNGEKLGQPTQHVPKGVFFREDQFVEAAVDALKRQRGLADQLNLHYGSKDLGAMATYAEAYNGYGYRNRGLTTPYSFAGTDQYTGGRYVADGKFDPNSFDRRPGIVAIAQAWNQRYPD